MNSVDSNIMTIYNLYIYNRKGECIYYREWNRAKQSGLVQEQVIISDKIYLKYYLDKSFEFKKRNSVKCLAVLLK